MATGTKNKTKGSKVKTKAAVVTAPEPEVDEVDESEVEEAAPAKAGVQEVTFGVSHLVTLIKEKTGKDTTTRELRTLLRKMARDGRLNREIVAGNRSRYDWSGPKDPEVKAVVKAFSDGELEADKQEKLAALKAKKAEATAAKKAAAEKAAPAEVEDDDDEDLDDDDE